MLSFCPLIFNLSLEQLKSGFIPLKPSQTCLQKLRKKLHNLHNLLHDSPFLSRNVPQKFHVQLFLFFYHTLSEGLFIDATIKNKGIY